MKTEIHRLSLGKCNCYLIKEDGVILVDAGFANQGEKFLRELKELSIDPKEISLILLTHGHWDHIGSANQLKQITGGKVAINQHEKDWVERGFTPTPPAVNLWGKIIGALINKFYGSYMKFPSTPADLVLEDKAFPLEAYGIRGKALHTPGHSPGAMSVLLETGDTFVGDLAQNGLPLRIRPGMPLWAEDIDTVKESWRLLLTNGAKWIYPAHWKAFKADELQKLL